MTLAQLSRTSGVLVRSLTAYENGRTAPSEASLLAIAAALDFPADFFALPDVEEIPIEALSFRAMSKMTAGQRDAARSSAAIASTINGWVEARFNIPVPDLPTLPHLNPEEAATNLRGAWGLGEAPINNLLHLAESKGVRIFSLAADCKDVDAFCLRKAATSFIFLNLGKSGERGRFDLAHEIGHLVMHSGYRVPYGQDAEQEADKFASAFLMPRPDLLTENLRLARVDQILRAKHRWGVSAMALNYRLRDLGLLTEWLYASNAKALSQKGYRRGEPGGMARESSQLWRKVIEALIREGQGWSAIAAELGLTAEELSAHLFGLVPVLMHGDRDARPTNRRDTIGSGPRLTVVGGNG